MSDTQSVYTAFAAFSLAVIGSIAFAAYAGSKVLFRKNARWQDRVAFVWLAFDAMVHFSIEGPFLYYSTFGRQVNTSTGILAEMWKEYAAADFRWGNSDPTVVSLEILTVLGAGPLCCYILKQLVADDPARHYWIVLVGTAEIYGTWMTFCPEWLSGNTNMVTSNILYLWVYLTFLNGIWVLIPGGLMIDSYFQISRALRSTQANKMKRI